MKLRANMKRLNAVFVFLVVLFFLVFSVSGEEDLRGSVCPASYNYICDVSSIHALANRTAFNQCYGDADGNGFVNPGDRGYVSANIGQSSPENICLYDIDGNGFVNPGDRGYVSANIGLCAPIPDFQNGSGLRNGVSDPRFPRCGDGILQNSCEVCDGTNLDGNTCADFGYSGGNLRCLHDCSDFSYIECLSQTCGNGVREGPEECDGNDFGDLSCEDFGYGGGNLVCGNNCISLSLDSCTNPILCANGEIDAFEECDDGNRISGDSCSSVCVAEELTNGLFELNYGYQHINEEIFSGVEVSDGYVFLENDGIMTKLVKVDEHGNSCGRLLHGILCNDTDTFVRRLMQYPAATPSYQRFGKANKILKTNDGGYFIVLETTGIEPNDWNPAGPNDGPDLLVIKTDSRGLTCNYFNSSSDGFCQGTSNGINVFARAIGGLGTERIIDISKSGNEFIIAAASDSFSDLNLYGLWLFKISSSGVMCNYLTSGNCAGTNNFAKYHDGLVKDESGSLFFTNLKTARGGIYVGADGKIVVVNGGEYFMKFSSSGQICSYDPQNVMGCSDDNSFLKIVDDSSVIELNDVDGDGAGYIISGGSNKGSQQSLSVNKMMIMRANLSGESCNVGAGGFSCRNNELGTFKNHFNFVGSGYAESGYFTKFDGDGYVFGGEISSFKYTGPGDIWIFKTDLLGNMCEYFNPEGRCYSNGTSGEKISNVFGNTANDKILGLELKSGGGVLVFGRTENSFDEWSSLTNSLFISTDEEYGVDFTASRNEPAIELFGITNGSTIETRNTAEINFNVYNFPLGYADFGGNVIRIYRLSPNFDVVPYDVYRDYTLKDYQLNEEIFFVDYRGLEILGLQPNTTYTYRFVLADENGNNILNGQSEEILTFRTAN